MPILPPDVDPEIYEAFGYYPTPRFSVELAAPFHSSADFEEHMRVPRFFVELLRLPGTYQVEPILDLDAPIFKNYYVAVTPGYLKLVEVGNLAFYIDQGYQILQEMEKEKKAKQSCTVCINQPQVTLAGVKS